MSFSLVFSGYWPFNQLICDLWNILDHIFCITSISTVVYISGERFLSIKYPLKHKSVLTKGRSIVHLCSIWAINTVIWSLYIGLTQYYFGKQRDLNQCSVYFLNYTGFALFNATVLVAAVVATSILYACIYKIVRKSSTFRKDLQADRKKLKRENTDKQEEEKVGGSGISNIIINLRTSTEIRKIRNREDPSRTIEESQDRKATRTIAMLLVIFAVCWLPLSLVFIMEAVKPG